MSVESLGAHEGTTVRKTARLTEWQITAVESLRSEYGARDEYPRPPSFSATIRKIVADWLHEHHDEPERLVDDEDLLEAAVETAVSDGKAASKRATWRDRTETHLRDLFSGHHPARPVDLRGPDGAVESFVDEARAYAEWGPWDDERLDEELAWLDDRIEAYERAYESRDLVPTDGFESFRAVEVGAGLQRLRADRVAVAREIEERAEGSSYDPDATVEAVAREWDVPEESVRIVVDEILVPTGTDWRQALRDGSDVEFAEIVDDVDDALDDGETPAVEADDHDDVDDDLEGGDAFDDAADEESVDEESDDDHVCDVCGATYGSAAALGGHAAHCSPESDEETTDAESEADVEAAVADGGEPEPETVDVPTALDEDGVAGDEHARSGRDGSDDLDDDGREIGAEEAAWLQGDDVDDDESDDLERGDGPATDGGGGVLVEREVYCEHCEHRSGPGYRVPSGDCPERTLSGGSSSRDESHSWVDGDGEPVVDDAADDRDEESVDEPGLDGFDDADDEESDDPVDDGRADDREPDASTESTETIRDRVADALGERDLHSLMLSRVSEGDRDDGPTIYAIAVASTTMRHVDDAPDHDVPVLDCRTAVIDADGPLGGDEAPGVSVSLTDNGLWLPREGAVGETLAQSVARASADVRSTSTSGPDLEGGPWDGRDPLAESAVDNWDTESVLDAEVESAAVPEGQHVDTMRSHGGIDPSREWGYGAGPPPEVHDLVDRLEDAGLDPSEHLSRLVWGKKEPMDRVTRPVSELTGNYGIETLPRDEGLVMIDVDYPDELPAEVEEQIPDTLEVSSPHGDDDRRHVILYCSDKERVADAVGGWAVQGSQWGDLWIGDRFVVGPGSQLSEFGCDNEGYDRGERGGCDSCSDPDGGRYRVVSDAPIAEIDAETLLDLLRESDGFAVRDEPSSPDAPETDDQESLDDLEADDDEESAPDVPRCEHCGHEPDDPESALKEVPIGGESRRICRGGCE